MDTPSFLDPSSPQAQVVYDLFVGILIVAGVIFLIVAGVLTYTSIRYRAGNVRGEPRPYFGNTRLEIAWTIGPLVILAVIFGFTVRTMSILHAPTGLQPDLVLVGHQWWWEVLYPKAGFATANEVHIPVGKKLLVRLEAGDVIHSFWVPQLGRKMDLVPGHTNYMWLEASEPGSYLGACAEYCGRQHAWMRVQVIAEPPAVFEAWQRRQAQQATGPTAADAVEGARLFQEMACATCHAIQGTAARARIGPDLTHLAGRQTLGAGVLRFSEENLARWLKNPQAVKPGSHMPDFKLTDVQVSQLTAYLGSLK